MNFRFLLAFMMVFSGAMAAVCEKLYIVNEQVVLCPKGFEINLNDDTIFVNAIFADEEGIYIPAVDRAMGLWTCPKCWYSNSWFTTTCKNCGYRCEIFKKREEKESDDS